MKFKCFDLRDFILTNTTFNSSEIASMQRTIASKSRGSAVTESLKTAVCCWIKEKLWFGEIFNDSKSGLA
jgi:hypothetical protein